MIFVEYLIPAFTLVAEPIVKSKFLMIFPQIAVQYLTFFSFAIALIIQDLFNTFFHKLYMVEKLHFPK